MNRRDSLKSLASAAAAGAWTLPAPGQEQPAAGFSITYLLASALYGDMKLEAVLPQVAPAGCAGLDLWGLPHATHREEVDEAGAEAFAALLEQHQVRLICSTRYPLGPFGLQPEMPFLKQLGGELLVCASRGPRNVTGAEAKAGIKEFLELMQPHADAAGEQGLAIAIENHGNALLASPDSIRYWAEFNDHPALGVAFAPHHLHEHVEDMPVLIRELGRDNLPFIYFQEHGIGSKETVEKEIELEQLPGRGSLDYTPILQALRDIQFSGYAEIFMHPTPRGIPMLPDAAGITAVVNESRAYLDQCLARTAA